VICSCKMRVHSSLRFFLIHFGKPVPTNLVTSTLCFLGRYNINHRCSAGKSYLSSFFHPQPFKMASPEGRRWTNLSYYGEYAKKLWRNTIPNSTPNFKGAEYEEPCEEDRLLDRLKGNLPSCHTNKQISDRFQDADSYLC
jgi:hypothetical protein